MTPIAAANLKGPRGTGSQDLRSGHEAKEGFPQQDGGDRKRRYGRDHPGGESAGQNEPRAISPSEAA